MKTKDYIHTTKDGKDIPIREMTLDHLKNTIAWIERKAKEGLNVMHGGGFDPDGYWWDEEVLSGKEVKEYLNYQVYKRELRRREKEASKPVPDDKLF